MKKKILITYSIPNEGLISLERDYELIYPTKEFFAKNEIINLIPDCIGLLSIFNREIDSDIIQAGQNLKIISNYGVGFNNIDLEEANRNNITVCNTPEAVCEPTAELCLGLILSLTRQIAHCHHELITNSEFEWGVMKNLGNTLQGKTLGIIGMGKIGKSVAQKAKAFGMNISYHNRKPIVDTDWKDAEYMNLNELLQKSDIISLHCPLTPETHHLIGKDELNQMKQSAFLINTARGQVVNESALATALQNEIIAGAALDVFENEPMIHPDLLVQSNIIVVPHIGTATYETRIEMAEEASQNIIDFMSSGSCKNKVN